MRFLGGSRKTNIEWGFPEKGGGAWTVYRFRGKELARKRGWCF